MTLRLELSDEFEDRLRHEAALAGTDVEGFVQRVVQEKLSSAAPASSSVASSGDSDPWLTLFEEWVTSHPARANVHLDDSRESIYAGRGE